MCWQCKFEVGCWKMVVADKNPDAKVDVVWLVFAGDKECEVKKTVRLLPFGLSEVETCWSGAETR